MAHLAKHTRAAVGHLLAHYDRQADHIGNENIDLARTPGNYNLGPGRSVSQGDFIRQRCSEVKMQNRKDVNVMCSWVVTTPADLSAADRHQFFRTAYDFMTERYGGEQNVVSAYVHMDEITPHMHFAFVPVVVDLKRGGEKVSAKEAVNRRDLQTFHKKLSHRMEQVFGRDIGIENGAVKANGGNQTIPQLKEQTERAIELKENNDALSDATDARYERQKREFAKADDIMRQKIKNAEAEAQRIVDNAQVKYVAVEKERDNLFSEVTDLRAESNSLQTQKNALLDDIAQRMRTLSKMLTDNQATAVRKYLDMMANDRQTKIRTFLKQAQEMNDPNAAKWYKWWRKADAELNAIAKQLGGGSRDELQGENEEDWEV